MDNLSQDATKESFTMETDEESSVAAVSQKKDFEPRRYACDESEMEGTPETQDKDPKINRSDGSFAKSIPDDKSHAPVPSVLSMKSDRSKGLPENFRGNFTQDFTHNRDDTSHKPLPSVLSMKSDRSKGLPENFKGDLTQDARIQLDQPDSSSIVSTMTSHVSSSWILSGKYNPILSPENARCDVCSKKAVNSCLTCIASYCEDHVKPHYTAPALQRHKLVEATADLEQRLCQHHNKVLDLFCQFDDKPVCALCLVDGHKGHELIPYPEDSDITPVLHMEDQELIIREDIPPPGIINLTLVKPESVSLSWELPEGLTGSQRFRVSVKCSRDQRTLEVQGSKINIQGLIPHEEYGVMVATLYGQGHQSTWVSESIRTEVPVPQSLTVTTTTTSIRVTWRQPHGLDQASYLITLKKSDEHLQTISTEALECFFSELQPATKYTIEAVTVKNGHQSKPLIKCFQTNIPVPENLKASYDKSQPTKINLNWTLSDDMDHIPHNFIISYYTYDGKAPKVICTDSCDGVITGLTPYTEYKIQVCTNVESIGKSGLTDTCFLLGIPPITDLKVVSNYSTSVWLYWNHNWSTNYRIWHYRVSYQTDGSDVESLIASNNLGFPIEKLKVNREYTLTVTSVIEEYGVTSDPVSVTFVTGLSPPGPIQFNLVKPDSVSLCWGLPEGLTNLPRFRVSLCSYNKELQNHPANFNGMRRYGRPQKTKKETLRSMIVPCLEASFDGLVPGTKYTFSVATLSETGIESPDVFADTQTDIPVPADFKMNLEDLSCSWKKPSGVFEESYQLNFFRDEKCFKTICTTSLTCSLSGLEFETEYTIKILTLLNSGCKSKPLSEIIYIDVPVPADFNVDSVSATSAEFSWSLCPVMEQIPHSFLISYQSEGTEPETISTDSYNTAITSLKPDTKYMVSVCTIIKHGGKSQLVTTIIHIDLPAPGPVKVTSVSSDSVSLCWGAPKGLTLLQKFKVSYNEKNNARAHHFIVPGQNFYVEDLIPGEEYEFSVATVSDKGRQSPTVLASICTEVPAPVEVHVDLNGKSGQVCWSKPAGLGEVSYLLTLYSDGECKKTVATKLQAYSLPELQYDTEYTISISCVLPNGRQSKPVSEVIHQRKKPRVD